MLEIVNCADVTAEDTGDTREARKKAAFKLAMEVSPLSRVAAPCSVAIPIANMLIHPAQSGCETKCWFELLVGMLLSSTGDTDLYRLCPLIEGHEAGVERVPCLDLSPPFFDLSPPFTGFSLLFHGPFTAFHRPFSACHRPVTAFPCLATDRFHRLQVMDLTVGVLLTANRLGHIMRCRQMCSDVLNLLTKLGKMTTEQAVSQAVGQNLGLKADTLATNVACKRFFIQVCFCGRLPHTGHVGAFTERDTLRRFSHWSLRSVMVAAGCRHRVLQPVKPHAADPVLPAPGG